MTGLARLIRDHGDAVEADLAFRGVDSRDLYRRGSGMTLRRLGVLIRGLPDDAALWAELAESRAQAEQHRKVSKLEDRQKRYQRKGGAA